MSTVRSYRRKVEWVIVLLYLLLPFIRMGGESALRFDVPTLKLHFFGAALWMQEFYFLLLASIFFVALFLGLTLVLGRVWCGWLCPQTIWSDLTGFIENKKVNKSAGHLALLLLSLVVGFITVCYFVSPYEAIPAALEGTLGKVPTVASLVLGVIFYLNFAFVRRNFCATICPYAKVQGVLTDSSSLIIQMNPDRSDECIECKMCVRCCPTGLDIREGMQVSCIMCAECVDTCNAVMGKKQKPGLITYSFGPSGVSSLAGLIRPGAVILTLVCLFSLSALIYQGGVRSSFDYSILPHPMMPRVTKDGGIINAYILSIKNRSQQEKRFSLELVSSNPDIEFSHSAKELMSVPAGLSEKYPVFIRSRTKPAEDLKVELILKGDGESDGQVSKTTYFTLP